MFHRKPRRPKHKFRPDQISEIVAEPAGGSFKQDAQSSDGHMEQRPATQPGKHRGPSAPLPGQVIGVKPVTDAPTRVLRATPGDTAVMPAATALPPSVTVPVTTRAHMQKTQTRVVAALGAPARPVSLRRENDQWFRPGADSASADLSLATFHRKWFAQMAANAPMSQPSPKTVVITAIGQADFPGSGVSR